MEIIFKATIFPDCHTETAATPHPRTGTPPGETVKATGTTARATGIPIPLAKKRRGAIYDARTPERRNTTGTTQRNKDTTATPSHHKKRRGAIYDARTPERRKRNEDTTAPHPAAKRRGAIYDARTPERRKRNKDTTAPHPTAKNVGAPFMTPGHRNGANTTGPHPRQSATVNADGHHKWRPHDTRNSRRRPLRTAADVGRAVLTSRKTGGFNLFLTGKATFQSILSVTLQRESSATGKTAKTRNRTIK